MFWTKWLTSKFWKATVFELWQTCVFLWKWQLSVVLIKIYFFFRYCIIKIDEFVVKSKWTTKHFCKKKRNNSQRLASWKQTVKQLNNHCFVLTIQCKNNCKLFVISRLFYKIQWIIEIGKKWYCWMLHSLWRKS